MKSIAVISILALLPLSAAECRVRIEGTGCRTRQLAIKRIFEKLPGVREVTILPRQQGQAENQRIFLIRSDEPAPDRDHLVHALGRRAKFYRVMEVTSTSLDQP